MTTKAEALKRIKGLPLDQQKSVLCALVGHSRIQSVCFGYWSCARCEAQVGDSLGGAYSGADKVIVGHDCSTCRENAKSITWRDTLLAPDPFPEAAQAAA
jgi:ribosomal protein L37AE/L43A